MENFEPRAEAPDEEDGRASRPRAARRAPSRRPAPAKERAHAFPQFLREVRAELRKVAWPTRPEVRNYSIIVLVTVVVFTTAITVLDYLFGTGALWLFDR